MGFKKLALVTAMFAATSGAYAMEAMDDESMAAATGQDGITIGITVPNLTLSQIIHDRNGLASAATPTAGAITIDNMSINTNGGEIVLTIDAEGNNAAANTAYLNINVALPNNLVINTGALGVAESGITIDGTGELTSFGTLGTKYAIMDSQTITLGATSMNIQLGNEVQTYTMGATTKTAMILLSTSMTGGLTIGTSAAGVYSGGLSLIDGSSGETISVGRMRLRDDGAPNLTVGSVGVNVEAGGLVIDIASIGSGTGLYQSMERVALGDATAAGNGYLGDIEVLGLQLSGTSIRISGH